MSDTSGAGNGNGTLTVRTGPGNEAVRKEFGATQVARSGETASSAVAAQARAMVEARYVMALQRPRDIDNARVRLLASCARPGFAKVARYRKPVGQGIEGPSIRLAEEAARCMGNIAIDISTIFDDEMRRVMRVSATDLEVNLPISFDVTVEKTIERNTLPPGAEVLRQRVGASGKTVYILQATDDDILNKANALASKALRGCILRLVPADILEDAMATVYGTLRNTAAKDPDGERKSVIDAFASLKVVPSMLKEFLGHEVGTCSPAEIVDLRDVYTTIKDGEATWNEVLEHKRKQRQDDGGAAEPPPSGEAPKVEGKRISLKTQPAQAPGAPTKVSAGAAPPADPPAAQAPRSVTIVKDGAEGARVASGKGGGQKADPADSISSGPGKAPEDAGDAPTAAEIAAYEAEQAAKVRGGAGYDDVPPWERTWAPPR